jgi:ArsR family transcriptional regulator
MRRPLDLNEEKRALDIDRDFHTYGDMEKPAVLAALAALSQESRLDIFRLLVQAGEGGMPAGKIGEQLGLPSATLAFHLKELKIAGLITFVREGRSLIYSAVYPAMNALLGYLTENCCQGNPAACAVVAPVKTPKRKVMA